MNSSITEPILDYFRSGLVVVFLLVLVVRSIRKKYKKSLTFLVIPTSLFCISCNISSADDSILRDDCGESMHQADMALTEDMVIHKEKPKFPTAPYRNEVSEGCVGLSFSIDTNGLPFNIVVENASPSGVFNRAAKKTLQKYTFQKPTTSLTNAYLIIESDLGG